MPVSSNFNIYDRPLHIPETYDGALQSQIDGLSDPDSCDCWQVLGEKISNFAKSFWAALPSIPSINWSWFFSRREVEVPENAPTPPEQEGPRHTDLGDVYSPCSEIQRPRAPEVDSEVENLFRKPEDYLVGREVNPLFGSDDEPVDIY